MDYTLLYRLGFSRHCYLNFKIAIIETTQHTVTAGAMDRIRLLRQVFRNLGMALSASR